MGEKQGPRLTGAQTFGSSDVFKALMIQKPGGEQVETRSDRRRSELPGLGVSQAGQKQARDQAKQCGSARVSCRGLSSGRNRCARLAEDWVYWITVIMVEQL